MTIPRYVIGGDGVDVFQSDTGNWVSYADHAAMVEGLEKAAWEAARLMSESAQKAGMLEGSLEAIGWNGGVQGTVDAFRNENERQRELVRRAQSEREAMAVQISNLTACYESVSASSRALREQINALTYCPYCGQGHAMHTAGCKILAGMLACAMAEAPK